MDENPSFFCTH